MKNIIPFLLGVLFLTSPGILWADQPQWPWTFEGMNFQITNNGGDNFSPSIASNGSLYLAVWAKSTPSGLDIYGVRMTSSGEVVGDEIPICTAPNDQMFPVVSWDGENFFVVWQDKRSGKRWDIYGAWVTTDGQVIDSDGNPTDGIPIAVGTSTYDQVSPALSFDGENYLVVWQGKRTQKIWNVYFAVVSKSGEVTGIKPISPSLRDQASPSVDFDGENYLIVWQDKRGGKFWDIYGASVTPLGEILGSCQISPIDQGSLNGWDKWKPVLSWDGNLFLVIWTALKQKQWYIEGKRVSAEGKFVDLIDIQIEKNNANKAFPAVLWDGNQYLLVWEDEPEGASKIDGASILPLYKPFTTSETEPISSPDAENPSLPAVSRIGDEILIIWQAMGPGGYWQIYGQRFKKQTEILSDSLVP